MPIVIHISNRMEILIDHLADVVSLSIDSPLIPESIVVQSQGMSRWISMELAKKNGVWANCNYIFPNKFIKDMFKTSMSEIEQSELFESEILTWRIIQQLRLLLDKTEFVELQAYITNNDSELKIYQLAEKIADTFDQYTLYRGDILQQWESGADGGWQAILWRALTSENKEYHRSKLKSEFIKRIKNSEIDTALLPRRVILFALSYMPAFHIEILTAVATFVDVHIFVLSPCREYWGDILSQKKLLKMNRKISSIDEEGNALLASLGDLGKNFSNLILECSDMFDASIEEHESYMESESDSLLASIQNGILNLRNADEKNKIAIFSADKSISVHVCHSALREVEVLHDQLLDMFATMDGLMPRDIIVMMPDLVAYSAYISAVFSGGQESGCHIPFTIADKSIRSEGRVGETLLAIMNLVDSRFTAPELFEILSFEAVCSLFDINLSDMPLIKKWLEETHITWGMTPEERTKFGFPEYFEGTWMHGLQRLLLGYAVSSDENSLVMGILPFDNMEGDHARILGHFVKFVKKLHSTVLSLKSNRSLLQWQETLKTVQSNFIKSSKEVSREYNVVERIIESLSDIETLSGYKNEVGLDVIKFWFQKRLEYEKKVGGFLSGKVTFCEMLPMRSIPMKVVVLLGMNDGAFPRQSNSPSFDIIPVNPRAGDRSLRNEDRYLFLEAILASRQRFYISYTGLDIRDDSIIPPSVLVSELLDFIDRGYICNTSSSEKVEFKQTLLTRHRLQPFSSAYFDGLDTKFFSYSSANLLAVRGLVNVENRKPYFFNSSISTPDESYRNVSISDLLKFFENPSAFILRSRLGIKAEESVLPLEEREIFELNNLTSFKIKKELLERVMGGAKLQAMQSITRAKGILPPNAHGDAVFSKLSFEAILFAEKVLKNIENKSLLQPLDVDFVIGKFRIYGRITKIYSEHLLRYRTSKLSAKDQLKLWIEHIILNFVNPEGYPLKSKLIMLDGSISLSSTLDSKEILENILNLYWEGLSRPLHFFPRSSLAFAEKVKISAAENEWNNKIYPERDDYSYKLCFGEQSPLDTEFENVSLSFFSEYYEHIETI